MLRGTVDASDNPCVWWRKNEKLSPLLARFFKATCPFPATSTSSERAFNMDGLIITPTRYCIDYHPLVISYVMFYRQALDPDRTGNMIVSRDYWMSRSETESFSLCDKCPPLPSTSACYKISCSKHQK